MKTQKEKKWEWSPVEGALQNKQNQCIFPNLTPQTTHEMQLMTSGKIELRKMFNFNPESGWNWHWSCNLPQMEYSIVSLHQNLLEDQPLQVELFITSKSAKNNILIDEGVEGVSKYLLKGNSVNFKGLKFKTSPDDIQEKSLQLLFVLYYIDGDGSAIIVDSHISPTIFIGLDNSTMVNVKTQNMHFLIDPFLPIFIDKELVKRERKSNQYTIQKIENSLAGFNNYFTSSNIRYKIIHPLFLFFKFSSFIRLYVTSELSEKNISNMVEEIQINIYQLMAEEKVRKFVILFFNLQGNDETKKKVPISKLLNKTIKIIQKLENNYYEIYTQEGYLPKDITEIKDIQTLIESYKQQHATLGELKSKKNQQNQQSKPQKKQEKMDFIVSSLTCDQNFEKSEEIQINKLQQPIKLENQQQHDKNNKPVLQKEECLPQNFQNYCNQYNQEWNQRYYYGNQMNQNFISQYYQYYMNQPNQQPYGWPQNYPFL